MGKLIAVEMVSLDGVMQAPGRPDEDTRGGFAHGGWASAPLAADPEAARAPMAAQGAGAEAMLFGHRTYVDLVGHWLAAPEPNPFATVLRDTPKYVASRNPEAVLEHPNSHLLEGDDAVASVRALTERIRGDIVVLGSGMLVRDLAAEGLIDEYILTIVPLVLGSGTKLFGDHYAPMSVRTSSVSPTGIVVATYAVESV